MGGNPEMRTDLWDGRTYDGDPEDARKMVLILASWVRRQSGTSVEFHLLVEILGLGPALQRILDDREEPATKQR